MYKLSTNKTYKALNEPLSSNLLIRGPSPSTLWPKSSIEFETLPQFSRRSRKLVYRPLQSTWTHSHLDWSLVLSHSRRTRLWNKFHTFTGCTRYDLEFPDPIIPIGVYNQLRIRFSRYHNSTGSSAHQGAVNLTRNIIITFFGSSDSSKDLYSLVKIG